MSLKVMRENPSVAAGQACPAMKNIRSQILDVRGREWVSCSSDFTAVTDGFSRFTARSTMLSDSGSVFSAANSSNSKPHNARFINVAEFCFLAFRIFTIAELKTRLCETHINWFSPVATVGIISSIESKCAHTW